MKQFKAVTAAEDCCHTLYTTYALRDPLRRSNYLNERNEFQGDKNFPHPALQARIRSAP